MVTSTPGDKSKTNDEVTLNLNNQDSQPEQVNNLEPVKPAETAGLSVDELGTNAKQTSELQDPTNPENSRQGPDAQTLNNQEQSEETIFTASPHSNEVAFDQINKGLQGAAEGLVDGVMGSEIETIRIEAEKKAKRERTNSIIALSSIENMQQLAEALDQQRQALEDLKNEVKQIASQILEIDEFFTPRIKEMEDLLEQQQQELQDLLDQGASAQEIEQKEQEIENTDKLLTLYKDTHQNLKNDFEAANSALSTAQQNMQRLQSQVDQYTDSEEKVPQELLDQMEQIQKDVKQATEKLAGVENRIEFTQKMMDISSGLHNNIAALGSSCAAESTVKAQAEFIDSVIKFSEDGKFTAEEAQTLGKLAKDSGYSQEKVNKWADDVANSGIAVLDKDGKEMTPDEVKNFILSEWKEIQEEKLEVEEKIDTSSAELAALKAQIDQAKQTLAAEQAELTTAQAALKAEQAQTAQAAADAQSIVAAMSQYEDIQDYMEQNYSITVGVGPLSKTFGTGEDIGDVAKDESRILKDSEGNFVYMSSKDQTLYTLEKNEDGTVKLDAEGKAIPKELSVEEALSLQSKMYADKLVPRNFVADEAYAEHSVGNDGFLGTMAASFMGMEKGEQQANIDKAVDEQKRQEIAAQDAESQASKELLAAQDTVSAKQQNVNDAQKTVDSLEQQYAALLEKESALRKEAVANNVNIDEATQVADTKESESDSSLADNTEMGEPAPAYDHEHSVYLGKLEQQIGVNGAISPEELEELLANAPEGIDLDKVKADLEEKGLLSPENQPAPQLAQNEAAPQQNTLENQPAPSNERYVTYNTINQTVEVLPIAEATVTPPENGVYPAIEQTSFADSAEFSATNDPNNPDATYLAPYNNGTSNVVSASSRFGNTPAIDQPAVGTGAPTPEQQTALEQARKEQLERDIALQQQQNQLAQNDSKVAPNSGAGTGTGGMM